MSKPIILAVDDETEIANIITENIQSTGRYDVITAYSAIEALKELNKNKTLWGLGANKVSLIISDIKMPEMDGLEFLERVRKDYGENIGVIMLTAWEDEEKWDRATAGFVINYIKKPYKRDELIKTIDSFFEGKEGELVLKTFAKHIEKREQFKKKQ